MSSRKILRITLFGTLFIAAAVALLFLTRSSGAVSEIALPDTVPAVSGVAGNPEGIPEWIELLTISTDNVQDVIATLERPDAYSRNIFVESFWDGGSAVYSFDAAVRGGATALRTFSGGTAKNIIVTDDYTYIWYAGDSRPITKRTMSDKKPDEYQMVLTYEDILLLDRSQIISAGLINDDNGPGVFIRYISGELGYVTECRVSITLGLIIGAEQYDGEELVYRMAAGECNLEGPGMTAFALPDGTNVFARLAVKDSLSSGKFVT